MNRRRFLASGCACCAAFAAAALAAQEAWEPPPRFVRPEISTDEGGLWALMDREEQRLRRSPFVVRDPALNDYVRGIACRIAGAHCPDIRAYLVRTPLFNAAMAPNGMMQVWTGLMLRMENEAQFAAVLGHEIGHYLARHSVERLRDARSRSAFGQFLGLFGLPGAVGQLALLASGFAYSRDQEREADRISVLALHRAGYDASQASAVWANLIAEIRARPGVDQELRVPMFATHPAPEERWQTLATLAKDYPGGATHETIWRDRTKPFRREWLAAEVKRGQHEESIALFTRMLARFPDDPDFLYARGEAYRLRATEGDLNLALADLKAAAALENAPAEVHRGIALIQRRLGRFSEARESFQRYLAAAPDAPDATLIKSYLEELGK
jgi:predicted Zn-dependent protease